MDQPIIQPRSERLGNVEWESHLKSWKKSGLSKAEYCRRKQISYHAFNHWQKKFEKSDYSSPITLVKLEESEKITTSFQQPPASPQSIIRFWVNDFCIEIGNHFSKTSLIQLIKILRSI